MTVTPRPATLLATLLLACALGVLGGCKSLDLSGADGPTASVTAASEPADRAPDDLSLGREQFRAQNYGLAETHFRRAIEAARGDAEAWLGLAATYDQLRRFDLADRAYAETLRLTGPTAELLNNRGYSLYLRGQIDGARRDLAAAAAKAPADERIRVNLRALERSARRG